MARFDAEKANSSEAFSYRPGLASRVKLRNSRRLRTGEAIDEKTTERVPTPYNHLPGKSRRYCQEIAINRAVQAILQGKRRVLLTPTTYTGKTVTAFPICYTS